MEVILTLVVVLALVLWAVSTYSRLIDLRRRVRSGWSQIDVQLKRRHACIRNLVNTVRGATEVQDETLEAVVAACNQATSASGPADAAAREGQLTQALGRLFALIEMHPQLRTNQDVRAIQDELTASETTVRLARHSYNDLAKKYNTATQVVPNNIIAGFGSFPPAEWFEMKERR